jgi:hypothetical protein
MSGRLKNAEDKFPLYQVLDDFIGEKRQSILYQYFEGGGLLEVVIYRNSSNMYRYMEGREH